MAILSLLVVTGQGARAQDGDGTAFSMGGVDILGDGPDTLELSAGIFSPNDPGEGVTVGAAAVGRVEYRYGGKLWIVGPALGVLATSDGGAYIYGGLYGDIRYRRFILTPAFAVGGYRRGEGENLGGGLQFRSALTLSYRFNSGYRVGVGVSHISNGGIHSDNPGTEEAFLSFSIPITY